MIIVNELKRRRRRTKIGLITRAIRVFRRDSCFCARPPVTTTLPHPSQLNSSISQARERSDWNTTVPALPLCFSTSQLVSKRYTCSRRTSAGGCYFGRTLWRNYCIIGIVKCKGYLTFKRLSPHEIQRPFLQPVHKASPRFVTSPRRNAQSVISILPRDAGATAVRQFA